MSLLYFSNFIGTTIYTMTSHEYYFGGTLTVRIKEKLFKQNIKDVCDFLRTKDDLLSRLTDTPCPVYFLLYCLNNFEKNIFVITLFLFQKIWEIKRSIVQSYGGERVKDGLRLLKTEQSNVVKTRIPR